MNLNNLKSLFKDRGCNKLFVKKLSANDNSKNQVYLAKGSWELLNIFPISDIKHVTAGEWKQERFKAAVNFYWLNDNGESHHAPNAQFILYPEYPEIRFSGFLLGCGSAPRDLMTTRLPDRLLLLGVSHGKVFGYVTPPYSEISQEINQLEILETLSVFKIINIDSKDSKQNLLDELYRIHKLSWIRSKSLTKNGFVPCEAPNCGGYTLEAELGILRNGISEPDFQGWEIKNFGVKSFDKLNSSKITLFTPEPTAGIYKNKGVEYFIREYGSADKSGRLDRLNFVGPYKCNKINPNTGLTLTLIGFDIESGKIRNTDGCIALLDNNGNEAASWSFSSLLIHWNRKHNQACYVPSMVNEDDGKKYRYGEKVILGVGTEFQLFLKVLSEGLISYDPGIKLEGVSTSKPKSKKRSQFRIQSKDLRRLYKNSELITFNY